MDDLIDRQAAIKAFWSVDAELRPSAIDAILNKLNGLPSAQPEIIRCKDCKHYLRPHGCGYIDGMVTAQEDGFCSYAERREE